MIRHSSMALAIAGFAACCGAQPLADPPPARAESAAAAPEARVWMLRAGQPIHQQLIAWGAEAGWQVSWQPRVSWRAAANARFEGRFEDVIQQVVQGLFFEGKPVRLVLWEGNQVAEVVSNDVR